MSDFRVETSSSRRHEKVLNEHQLEAISHGLRKDRKLAVQCHGVFDLLHLGHVQHLEEAKLHGEILIVSVTSDEYVNKGPGRPVFRTETRAMMLAALEVVDYVFISRHPTAVQAIQLIRPHTFVKGPDYSDLAADATGNIQSEVDAVEKNGGVVVFTEAATMSSSALVNSAGMAHTVQLSQWLREAREKISDEIIDSWFSDIKSLKVLVVGETIIDKYVFCEALGKTSKDPILAFLGGEEESQLGGAIAVARHVAGLGAQTTLLSRLGTDEEGTATKLRLKKDADISTIFQESAHAPTIVKRRFVDQATGAKVFETYEMSDEPATEDMDDDFWTLLDGVMDEFDLILVADYGHGLLSQRVLEKLSSAKGTVAANTQSNAGNRGFNSISRYPRVDILCLNGSELQLELKKKHATVGELMPTLGNDLGADWVVVTEGAKGLALWGKQQGVQQMPAFTEQVKDRVGAGDALFATVSVLLKIGAHPGAAALFGNLAGASMVSNLGNRESVRATTLMRHARTALK